MSVIGRLDEQVNDVLISPLDRNRQSAPAVREQPINERDAQPPTSHTHEEDESSQNERAAHEDLPVWLL